MPRKTVYNQITSDESIKRINPKNKELCSDFLDYLASVGRAPSTINGYRNDLEIFFCWNLEFNNNKFFIDIKKRELTKFQGYALNEWGWSPKRIRRVKSTISSMSNYIEDILQAQEKRISELENKIMLQESEIKKYNQKLYDKQKTYHEQSIQIRSNLEQNQDLLSKQITDFSNMMKDYINVQNARTIASFRSSLWRMHRDFTNQGYITADGLKTFLEMGKLYEDAGGDDIYHSKLLPEITALEIRYSKDDIIDKI